MYLEARETARLYTLLSDKLGDDTTEAMFKYIDNKAERAVEATIQTLATKDDVAVVREDMAKLESNLSTKIAESKADNVKWMFIFWIGQVAAMLALIMLFLKK